MDSHHKERENGPWKQIEAITNSNLELEGLENARLVVRAELREEGEGRLSVAG